STRSHLLQRGGFARMASPPREARNPWNFPHFSARRRRCCTHRDVVHGAPTSAERIFEMAIFSKHEAKPLGERLQKARSEGRTQQALELAKQLAKQEPTPEHRELLRSVTFERGCQLLSEGKQRDAIVVFQN